MVHVLFRTSGNLPGVRFLPASLTAHPELVKDGLNHPADLGVSHGRDKRAGSPPGSPRYAEGRAHTGSTRSSRCESSRPGPNTSNAPSLEAPMPAIPGLKQQHGGVGSLTPGTLFGPVGDSPGPKMGNPINHGMASQERHHPPDAKPLQVSGCLMKYKLPAGIYVIGLDTLDPRDHARDPSHCPNPNPAPGQHLVPYQKP
jgi:hypothetical protein